MVATEEEFLKLKKLIVADNRTEVECAKFLHYAQRLLVPRDCLNSRVYLENINIYGRSDFFIVAKILTEQRDEENFAYFFEAKAPQLFVMEFDGTKNRCTPTADLMQAENQLMHYTSEAAGNKEWLLRHDIPDGRNVIAGGIIIGRRKDRYLKGDDPDASSSRLARRALKLREEYFYKSTGMRVFLWDRILDYIAPTSVTSG